MTAAKVHTSVLDLNTRRLYWTPTRRRLMKQVFAARPKSIITTQETTPRMRLHIESDLGPDWNSINHGKVVIFYDKTKWKALRIRRHDMKTPGYDRRLLLVQFERLNTGGRSIWVGTTHLSVHLANAGAWRRRQATAILVNTRSLRPLLINGDINESALKTGVRQIFAAQNIKDAWVKAPLDKIHNRTASSVTGFRATKYNSRRLDVMLSSSGVDVLAAGIYLTGKASDHNMLSEDITF